MTKSNSGEPKLLDGFPHSAPVTETPLKAGLRAVLLAFFLWAAWSAAFVFGSAPSHVDVILGEPSPRDILAPRQIVYISEIKTQEARIAAVSKVADIYSEPDLRIRNRQLRRLQAILTEINEIRKDSTGTRVNKADRIAAISDLNLATGVIETLLDLDTPDWEAVAVEAVRVLDVVMQEEIRQENLATHRSRVTLLTAHTLSDAQQLVVVHIARNLTAPNTFLDSERTLAAREAARESVEPVYLTIRSGESVLREGEIATTLALEKLEVLGMLGKQRPWQQLVALILFPLLLVAILAIYVAKNDPLLLWRPRRELLLTLTLVVAGVSAYFIIPGRTLVPYLFPAAAVSMLITILLDVQLGVVSSVVLALVVGFSGGGSIELVMYALLGSVIGGLTIWRMDQLGAFVRAAVYVMLANLAVIVLFYLLTQTRDAVGLLQMLVMGAANAVLSTSLSFVAFSLIGRVFGITTSLQLLELARPTHSLFRMLLLKAPGTYHHSIVISNMAERAATAIGADPLLARVGSYYHDIGKITQPYFFAENQSDGENPHDKLDPKSSAQIIIGHVIEGMRLARKHHLPTKIRDFIPEHHGTTRVTYFYRMASQASEDVREEDFCYPGPKPQSRETAIVMLADGIEATVRANRPASKGEMERVVRQIINDRLVSGQLDECDLTLRDLGRIREAFISVLQGIFHPRIKYPEKRHAKRPSKPDAVHGPQAS